MVGPPRRSGSIRGTAATVRFSVSDWRGAPRALGGGSVLREHHPNALVREAGGLAELAQAETCGGTARYRVAECRIGALGRGGARPNARELDVRAARRVGCRTKQLLREPRHGRGRRGRFAERA